MRYQSASSPVSRCTACSMVMNGRPGLLGVPDVAQQPQAHVVERHVAQMRAGIGEAHLDAGVAGQLLEHLGPVVGDRRAPAQRPCRARAPGRGMRRPGAGHHARGPPARTTCRSPTRPGSRRSRHRRSRGARPASRTCSRTPCGTGGDRLRRAAARCARPRRADAAPRRPAPNSSKITRSMPSAYTSNGTGRCCHRKLPPSRLTSPGQRARAARSRTGWT